MKVLYKFTTNSIDDDWEVKDIGRNDPLFKFVSLLHKTKGLNKLVVGSYSQDEWKQIARIETCSAKATDDELFDYADQLYGLCEEDPWIKDEHFAAELFENKDHGQSLVHVYKCIIRTSN